MGLVREPPKKGERWQHHKGNVYIIEEISYHCEGACHPIISYRQLLETKIWYHFLPDFMHMGPFDPRFKKVEEK